MFGLEIGVVIYIAIVICAVILAGRKGRSAFGWGLLCAVIPLAILILLCLSTQETAKVQNMRKLDEMDYRDCPFCDERIRRAASVCKHCGKDVEPKASVPKIKCPRCGYTTSVATRACMHCGAPVI